VLAQLQQNYPDRVRVVYRHFPLVSIHDKALLATQAAEAAGRQGAFWKMHALLFDRWNEWTELSVEDFTAWLTQAAETLGLDVERFQTDLTNPEIVAQAQAAWDNGKAIGIPGTPFLLINGSIYGGPMDYLTLSYIVELIALEQRQFTECPPMVIDPTKHYTATIRTEKGDIVIELYPDVAPMGVNNFVFLAQQGWYDGAPFHRVIPGFVAQGGDPSGTGYGGPGYAFDNETSPDLTFDRAGRVAYANAGPGTNGSQFFITYAPQPNLEGGYTIFGQVIEGMDVVEQLTPRDPSRDPNLPEPDHILEITIEVK